MLGKAPPALVREGMGSPASPAPIAPYPSRRAGSPGSQPRPTAGTRGPPTTAPGTEREREPWEWGSRLGEEVGRVVVWEGRRVEGPGWEKRRLGWGSPVAGQVNRCPRCQRTWVGVPGRSGGESEFPGGDGGLRVPGRREIVGIGVPNGRGRGWGWKWGLRRVPNGREVRGTPRGGGPDVPTCSASGPGAASPARRNPRLKKRRSAMRSRDTIPAPCRHHPGAAHPRTARAAGTPPPRHAPSRYGRSRHAPHLLRGALPSEDGRGGSDIVLQCVLGVLGVGRGSRRWSRCGKWVGIGRGSGWESQCGVVKGEPGVGRRRPCGERIRASLPSLGSWQCFPCGAGTGSGIWWRQQSPSWLNTPLVGIAPGVSPLPLLPSGACFTS